MKSPAQLKRLVQAKPGRITRARSHANAVLHVPDDTRARLLKAAVDVFAEFGYENATIRQICSRAGANVALVNYHFGDKLELYTAVLRYAMACGAPPSASNAGELACGGGIKPETALRQMVRIMVEHMIRKDDQSELRYRLMLHELARPTSVTALVVKEVMQPMYDRLRQILGAILNLPPDHTTTRLCTHSVLAQVGHYAQRGPALPNLWPQLKMTPQQREMVAEHIADFSLAYCAQYTRRN